MQTKEAIDKKFFELKKLAEPEKKLINKWVFGIILLCTISTFFISIYLTQPPSLESIKKEQQVLFGSYMPCLDDPVFMKDAIITRRIDLVPLIFIDLILIFIEFGVIFFFVYICLPKENINKLEKFEFQILRAKNLAQKRLTEHKIFQERKKLHKFEVEELNKIIN